jgi:hypothetical protein
MGQQVSKYRVRSHERSIQARAAKLHTAVDNQKMAYITPIHRPSSIRIALKLQFLEEGEDCLAIA